MNKNVYRIVFNKARRMYMVASENTHAKGKGDTVTTNHIAQLFIGLGLGYLTIFQAQGAGIVADSAAPSNQRPMILNAGNNVPLVNIQTPSAAGVSRNTYSQFDVGTQGAVLNNSRTDVQTQLGGYVQANPYLATGAARVILNEVNSNNPSLLQGYVEVAGSRAQVVIANPSGITCDGCGFINTTRTTLTTGSPNMLGGNLDSYRVERGTITVQGQGLDTITADYTDIITRAVNVNAGIWANTLKVTTGVNTVNADNSQVTVIAGAAASNAPSFAVDVASLGGMYAGKIMMIGTEAGVGVRNAGTIGASAGELVITQDGRLENTGILQVAQNNTLASGNLMLSAVDIDNQTSGQIIGGNIKILASNSLTNRGLIDSDDTFINSVTLNNIGAGHIYGNHITIQANTLNNKEETLGNQTKAAVIAARNRLDIGAKTITNQEHALLFSAGDMAIGGNLDDAHHATGTADILNNKSATIESLGGLSLTAGQINNTNEHFSTQIVQVSQIQMEQYQLASGDVYRPSDIVNFHDASELSFFDCEPTCMRINATGDTSDQWHRYNFVRTINEAQILTSDPGKIFAGSGMAINTTNLLNDKSQIVAGNSLTTQARSIENTEVTGQRTISDTGTATYYYRIRKSGRDAQGVSAGSYNPTTTVQSIALTPTVYQQNTTPTGTNTNIPSNSLFKANPNANNHYLIETDPRFTNYRTWLSSDYMLNALSYNPATTQKRLGDGFYEQKLIREQIAQLTGHRFLEGYASDEAQYQALMNNAVNYAKSVNLRPGIALSANQAAQLTTDIIWLVEQTVTLPDGSTTQALVPQVYVALKSGDLLPSGALISGNNVALNVNDALNNQGTIAGRNIVNLSTANLNNIGGQIHGADLNLSSSQDINNIGGSITASNNLTLQAGRDINVVSTTSTQTTATGSRTNIDRVAGLYVTAGVGNLVASAGNNINLIATQIIHDAPTAAGGTTLSAGKDINLGTVTTSDSNKVIWNSQNYIAQSNSQEVGTQIQIKGDLQMQTGNDINAKAASITSTDGALFASAGNNINLTAGRDTVLLDEAHQTTSHGFLSSSTRTTQDHINQSNSVGTSLSGNTVTLQAGSQPNHGGDINITGSNVVSDSATTLTAKNNVNINGDQNTDDEMHARSVKKSGFSFSNMSIGFGTSKLNTSDTSQSVTNIASTVGSVNGNLNIIAGNTYNQIGSDVLTPQGDINITAKNVNIQAATNTSEHTQKMDYKQTGITIGLSSSALNLAQSVASTTQAAVTSDSSRNKALNALQTYANASTLSKQGAAAVEAIKAGDAQGAADAAGIRLSVSIGTSKASSNSTTTLATQQDSLVKTGGNVFIKTTENDINIIGSQIEADKSITLDAAKNINLIASADAESNNSQNKSSSTSIGVSVGLGSNAGLSFDIAASRGKGQANSNSTTYNNTHITAGETLAIKSGDDTNLIGANAVAKKVIADIGGNLNIASLQDTATSNASQSNTGVGISIPVGVGAVRGSFSQSKQNSQGNYASVYEQSGIRAGDGGLQVNVNGNTDLKGAVIASNDKAIQDNKNNLNTQTLTTSDISNSMSAKAESRGLSASTNMLQGKYAMAKVLAGNVLNNGNANQSDASTTTSAISAAQVTVGNKTTDTSKALLTDSNGKTVSTDTSNTNRTLAKADVAALQKAAQEHQAANMLMVNAATALTDPAFRAAFLDQAKMYKKVPVTDDKGNTTFEWKEMTPEEKAKIPPGSRVANNGIFNGGPNDPKPAQDLANQNSSGGADYLIHFPQANNMISELLVAGYQKFLENSTTGLTNATQQNVDLWNQTGGNITLDGHSRGGMTVGNALTAIQEQGGAGGTTNVNLFGSAYNAQDAANTVNQVTDGKGQVKQSTNNYDLVGRLLGGNAGTGGSIPEGSSVFEEVIRTMGGAATVHNCYGRGNPGCDDRFGKDNNYSPPLVPVTPTNAGGRK